MLLGIGDSPWPFSNRHVSFFILLKLEVVLMTMCMQGEIVLKKTLRKIDEASNILLKWFSNSYMISNVHKFHLLTSTSKEVDVEIGNEIIKKSLQETLLGILIDNRLTFESHMESLCIKAGEKFHVLARIVNYMDISKKCSIMNPFIVSQFPYFLIACFTVENLAME